MANTAGGFLVEAAAKVAAQAAKGAYNLVKYGGMTVKEAAKASVKITAEGLKKGLGG